MRVNDEHLLFDDKILTDEVCAPNDRQKIREITELLKSIRKSFNYIRSPEFEDDVSNRSDSYREIKRKLVSDPVKNRRYINRLDESLENLLNSPDAFQLIPLDQHEKLKKVIALLLDLSNSA